MGYRFLEVNAKYISFTKYLQSFTLKLEMIFLIGLEKHRNKE